MPQQARRQYYGEYTQPKVIRAVPQYTRPRKIVPKKTNRNQRIVSIIFMVLLGFFVLPSAFQRVTMSFFYGSRYPEVKTDYYRLRFPTSDYLSNHWAFGERSLRGAKIKKPEMTPLHENRRLAGLENNLRTLMAQYPSIHPAIYAIDFDTGNYVDINGNELFPAASIIKLPVLIHLFRSIEMGQFSIYDSIKLADYYKGEGSGRLQFKAENSGYTIDELARMMITESDNSATNMLVAKLGSMNDVNHGIKEWGLGKTYMQTWLPDLGGTNKTTARDIAVILYNVDNPRFLSVSSRESIFDYMGHVENNRLIAAGLGEGADFLHKTGDIGTMLGDAGIVFTPNGKKYILVILARRPYNSTAGKEFIVKASEMIYKNIVNGER
ncbi:MAG: class A beta-lactamase-related serine hydrolase [Heliobacteriaceae bacterium]|jgi:beta-lactamase class A|nr:class A beta-lactamase-related serine hydrolase [Heliobacteriaceae bacterium]